MGNSKGFIEEAQAILGPDRVKVAQASLKAASSDESDINGVLPICVLRPQDTREVVSIVHLARRHKVPLTPRGAGTGLEGAAIPTPTGAVVDFSAMDKVLELVPEERRVTCEPGLVYAHLNRLLEPHGLFFPPAPGGSSDTATIGGMVSTDASGIYALKYGGTRRWVMSLEVVTGKGDVLNLGPKVPKSSSGYALKHLIVGSEGTLALITKVTLELAPLPDTRIRGGFFFEDLLQACKAALEMAAYVPEVAALELCDADTLACLRNIPAFSSLPRGHGLFIEVHGRKEVCAPAMDLATEVARAYNCLSVPTTMPDPWEIRHRTTTVIRESTGLSGVVRTDCAVPVAAIPDLVEFAKRRAGEVGRRVYIFGHIGLGILHFLFPLGGEGSWPAKEALAEKRLLGMKAISLGGTISGEHGIGLGNRDLMAEEHKGAMAYMKAIKAIFDPDSILNPDKIFSPSQDFCPAIP